jgi:ubiquinone/menaquinone biosynthesis C-methylase UbiE
MVMVVYHAAMKLAILTVLVGCGSPQKPAPEPAHQHHGHHAHRFDNAEQWAKVFDDPARDAWQQPDVVIAALALTPAMAVADVGAGTGYFTVRLARAVPQGQVVATDIEPDMVRYLNERAQKDKLANVRAVLSTADDPKLAPASQDRILVVDVWHHIADRARYASGLAAALRPGGQVAIVDFTQEANHGPPKEMRLAPAAIIAELLGAGLEAEVSPTKLPDQYIVIGTKR